MNLDDFSYEDNGRRYIDPNVSLNEQNAFIQNLRDAQGQNTAQIVRDTQNLGTNVPSNQGGLTGSEAYFKSRYQTPQTNSVVSNLKATAQAQALSTALNNELEKAKKRYQDAYKAASKRSGSGGNSGSNGNNGNNDNLSSWDGEVKDNPTDGGSADDNNGGGDNNNNNNNSEKTPPKRSDYFEEEPKEKSFWERVLDIMKIMA